jgi:hypothetical protein
VQISSDYGLVPLYFQLEMPSELRHLFGLWDCKGEWEKAAAQAGERVLRIPAAGASLPFREPSPVHGLRWEWGGGGRRRTFPLRRHLIATARARPLMRRARSGHLASGQVASPGGSGAVRRANRWERLSVRPMLIADTADGRAGSGETGGAEIVPGAGVGSLGPRRVVPHGLGVSAHCPSGTSAG